MTVQPARKLTRKLMTACLAACLLPIALPMLPATAAPGYKPPRRPAAQRTEGSGNRSGGDRIGTSESCAKDLAVPLTLLMPKEESQTSLAQPPLFLYLAQPKNLALSFYEVPASGSRKLMWTQSIKVEQAGIVQLVFPPDQPGLEIGKTYAWTAAIVCDPQKPSQTTSQTQTTFTHVIPSRWLQTQIKTSTSPRQKAGLYASSGFWIDTMVATAEALDKGTDAAAEQDLLSLLEQIGLKEIAQREQPSSSTSAPAGPIGSRR